MTRLLAVATAFVTLAFLAAACGHDKTLAGPDGPVQPDIAGIVMNSLGFAVAGATVAAIDGLHPGQSTVTDENGGFSLAGVQGPTGVNLRVSGTGYMEGQVLSTQAARPDGTLRILLQPATATSLKYTLSVAADDACSALPAEVRARSYTAVLLEGGEFVGDGFRLSLEGAEFYPTQRIMWGGLRDDQLTLYLSSLEAYQAWLEDDPIVEQLDDRRYLAVLGKVVTTLGDPLQTLNATFEGTISYCARGARNPTYFECSVPAVECQSSHHRLTVAR